VKVVRTVCSEVVGLTRDHAMRSAQLWSDPFNDVSDHYTRTMEPLDGHDDVRAVGGWLAVALGGALLPWQTTTSSLGCGLGGVCGWVSGPNSVYTFAWSAGPRSFGFWAWAVFLVVTVVGFAGFEVHRHFPQVQIPVLDLIGARLYRGVGVLLLLSALLVASSTASTTSSVESGGGAALVHFVTGPSVFVWVGCIAALALCRGGYLFKGVYPPSRILQRLLFDPDMP
jgi:hypothetical protein